MENVKTVQYFFDSKNFNQIEVINNLEKEREKEFENKEAKIDITLNDFGVYVATLTFEKKKKFIKNKENKISKEQKAENEKLSKYEKLINSQEERVYGKYKATKEFRPY